MAKRKSSEQAKPGAVAKARKFLGDVWREVHPRTGRVTWPAFKTVKVSTFVVIFSSIFLGMYIFVCDAVVHKLYSLVMGIGSNS